MSDIVLSWAIVGVHLHSPLFLQTFGDPMKPNDYDFIPLPSLTLHNIFTYLEGIKCGYLIAGIPYRLSSHPLFSYAMVLV